MTDYYLTINYQLLIINYLIEKEKRCKKIVSKTRIFTSQGGVSPSI